MFFSVQAYRLIWLWQPSAITLHMNREKYRGTTEAVGSASRGFPVYLRLKKVRQLSEDRWSLQYEVYCMVCVCRLDCSLRASKQTNKQAEVSSVSFRPRIWQEKYGIKCRVPAGSSKKREKQRNKRISVELVSRRVFGVGLRWSREGRPLHSA